MICFKVNLCLIQLLLWYFSAGCGNHQSKPNIIFIIADDLGWNDVGFRGSNQFPTPNIDALAYNGIVLDRHYTLPSCSPSRTAFLTGKYPIRTGMQGVPIAAGHPVALPLNETLLPEYLQRLGYVTRLVGKWHVGCHRSDYTPTRRGFHSYFGYLNGFLSYKNATHASHGTHGFDSYRNLQRNRLEVEGRYLTEVFTKEAVDLIKQHNKDVPLFLVLSLLAVHTGAPGSLEVKDENKNEKKFGYLSHPRRRLFAGMAESLDASVGKVIEALESKNLLQNSIVVFLSDNGGPTVDPLWNHDNTASNWPLRGTKMSPYEGGIRGVAAAWSPRFKHLGRTSHNLIHITDWLPTLYAAAGGDEDILKGIDGINQWSNLVYNDAKRPPRTQLLVNIDEKIGDWAVIKNQWKLVKVNESGKFEFTHHYYGESGRGKEYRTYHMDQVIGSPVSRIFQRYHDSDHPDPNDGRSGEPREKYLRRRLSLSEELINRCAERIAVVSNEDPYAPPNNTTGAAASAEVRCGNDACLFNIDEDPCEFKNVADQHPSIVNELYQLFSKYNSELVKQQEAGFDPAADPINWAGYWAPWRDFID